MLIFLGFLSGSYQFHLSRVRIVIFQRLPIQGNGSELQKKIVRFCRHCIAKVNLAKRTRSEIFTTPTLFIFLTKKLAVSLTSTLSY